MSNNTLAGKKALVILTNEAYIPKSRSTPRRMGNGMPLNPNKNNSPMISSSPSFWTSPQGTIMEPPMNYDSIRNSMDDFAKGHQPTGVDVFELGYLWMHLHKQYKMELIFATPRGGPVAADPMSVERIEKDSNLRDRLKEERDFIARMGHTLPISWVKPEEFKLVIIVGSHGAMFDLPEHDDIACAIGEIYNRNGYVAAIGHGVAGLLNVRQERGQGEYLIKNKRITCPTKEEERQMGVENYLPYMLEERLKERGARIDNKKAFESNVQFEERLITAQNAPSIKEFVEKINEMAKKF